MKTADVVENSGHCIYSIELKCFGNCLSLLHLLFYIYMHIYIHIDCKICYSVKLKLSIRVTWGTYSHVTKSLLYCHWLNEHTS